MAWYYYLENQLRFPFEARCIVSKIVSPLSKGETVRPSHGARGRVLHRHARDRPLARPEIGRAPVPIGRGQRGSINRPSPRRLAVLDCPGLRFLIYARLPTAHESVHRQAVRSSCLDLAVQFHSGRPPQMFPKLQHFLSPHLHCPPRLIIAYNSGCLPMKEADLDRRFFLRIGIDPQSTVRCHKVCQRFPSGISGQEQSSGSLWIIIARIARRLRPWAKRIGGFAPQSYQTSRFCKDVDVENNLTLSGRLGAPSVAFSMVLGSRPEGALL